jgi:hypothetical protein
LIIRSVVVLPQPELPSSTVISPLAISIVRLPTATVPSGYSLVTSLSAIMVSAPPPSTAAAPRTGQGGFIGQGLRAR